MSNRFRRTLITLVAVAIAACSSTVEPPPASEKVAALPPPPESASGYRKGLTVTYAEHTMAAAADPLAAQAGREMLRRGGSAIDAAIAMQAVLTLVEPQATGIGGGAFILYWDGKKVQAYDGRETAPMADTDTLFLGPDQKPVPFHDAQFSGRSVGVPGVLRVLELVHREHGRLPWKDLFEPAIRLCESGFPISHRLANEIFNDKYLFKLPDMAGYFTGPISNPLPPGTILRNPELADTLRIIANQGAQAFYEGPIAADIVRRVHASPVGGAMELADLSAYRAKERTPVCTNYERWRICGMPPPSSGGIAIAQILGIIEALEKREPSLAPARHPPVRFAGAPGIEPAPEAVHVVSEAERLAYADRGLYVADSDFVPVNIAGLTDPIYLASRSLLIGARSMGKATPGVPPGTTISLAEDRSPPRISTSQVVAVDADGGALSMTTTIESFFGSHRMVRGFLLNNQLTDFSFAPSEDGKPVANRVEPGKRPRSSMAPTLVFDKPSGQLVAVFGSPGGSQIIEYVAKLAIALLDWQEDPQTAVNLANFGSRNGPTELETGVTSPALAQALKDRGHDVATIDMTSGAQLIVRTMHDGHAVWAGGADPRREGAVFGD